MQPRLPRNQDEDGEDQDGRRTAGRAPGGSIEGKPMSRTTHAVRTLLAVAIGVSVAAPAFAQDPAKPPAPKAPAPKKDEPAKKDPKAAPAAKPTATAAKPATAKPATEDATKTLPTWEAYGGEGQETIEETFFRLTREFASTAEIGVRNLGKVPVWPRGELKLGSFRILPYLREGFQYDSNFFQVHRTGEYGSGDCANQAGYTWTSQLGALGDMPFAGGRARLTVGADSQWDIRFDDEDESLEPLGCGEQEDTWEFVGVAALSYRWPQGTYVRGGYMYERLVDAVEAETSGEFPRHNHRPFFVAGMDKDVLFGSKFRYEVGLNMRDTVADDGDLDDLDRTETEAYLRASYPFWKETTRLFGRVRYRQDERESEAINDGNVWGTDFGIEGTIPLSEGESRGLRGQLSLGFDAGSYEDENFGVNDDLVRDENSENVSLAVNAYIQYTISSKSALDLRYIRSNEFSYHGNYQIIDRFDLTFTHRLGKNLIGRLAAFYEHGDPSGRLSYQSETVGTDLTSEYPNTNRGGGGFGLRYALNDYADLDFYYNYERRNDRVNGFANHEAGIGVTIYLNALRPRRESTAYANAAGAPPGR